MTRLRTTLMTVIGLGLAMSAFAQASLTQTRLGARISSTQDTIITVSSGTNFTAGYLVYIDGEAMMTRSVSSTSITVSRGYAGTNAAPHVTGSIVWTGPAHYFYFSDPTPGNCRRSVQVVLPWINVLTGDVWYCSQDFGATLGGYWHAVNATPTMAYMPKTIIPQFAASAGPSGYSVRLDDVYISAQTYTGALEVFLPGATGLVGKILIIADEAGMADAAGNAITVRGQINNASNSSISSAYGLVRLIGGVTVTSNYVWFKW